MKFAKHIAWLMFFTLIVLDVHANSLFDQGLKAANEKKYAEAVNSFEKVIQAEPGNTSAYFNLGNCYYESKKYGKAIWAYERVLKYSPRDSEASMNIELCYKRLASNVAYTPHTSGIQRLMYGVGSNIWSILAIVLSLFMSLSIYYFIRSKNSSWKRMHFMILFGETIFFIAFVIFAYSSANYLEKEQFAIVTKTEISTFLNPQREKATLKLKEGTKIEIISLVKGSMYNVRLIDGKTSLINPEDIDKI